MVNISSVAGLTAIKSGTVRKKSLLPPPLSCHLATARPQSLFKIGRVWRPYVIRKLWSEGSIPSVAGLGAVETKTSDEMFSDDLKKFFKTTYFSGRGAKSECRISGTKA